MKVNQIISEKHYRGPLYHATGPGAALSIFRMGQFELGVNYLGGPFSKVNKSVNNFEYYMSTSRDKFGSYRVDSTLKLNALFVINPNKFNQHDVMSLPYNDFGNFRKSKGYNEAEEIILSKKDSIPINEVVEQFHYYNQIDADSVVINSHLEVMKNAISNYPTIEYYYYDRMNMRPFIMLNTRKAERIQ